MYLSAYMHIHTALYIKLQQLCYSGCWCGTSTISSGAELGAFTYLSKLLYSIRSEAVGFATTTETRGVSQCTDEQL